MLSVSFITVSTTQSSITNPDAFEGFIIAWLF